MVGASQRRTANEKQSWKSRLCSLVTPSTTPVTGSPFLLLDQQVLRFTCSLHDRCVTGLRTILGSQVCTLRARGRAKGLRAWCVCKGNVLMAVVSTREKEQGGRADGLCDGTCVTCHRQESLALRSAQAIERHAYSSSLRDRSNCWLPSQTPLLFRALLRLIQYPTSCSPSRYRNTMNSSVPSPWQSSYVHFALCLGNQFLNLR